MPRMIGQSRSRFLDYRRITQASVDDALSGAADIGGKNHRRVGGKAGVEEARDQFARSASGHIVGVGRRFIGQGQTNRDWWAASPSRLWAVTKRTDWAQSRCVSDSFGSKRAPGRW